MVMKILLFPIMVFIVLYVFIVQIVPIYNGAEAEKIQIEQKNEAFADAQQRKQKMTDFIQAVKAHPAEKEFASNFIPNDQREEILINDISQLAKKTNVELFSIGFSDENVSNTISDMRLLDSRLIISGSYQNMTSFINQLFHLKRIYTFKSIDLVKPEEGEEERQGDLIISGTIGFAYGYTQDEVGADVVSVGNSDIDYDLLKTIMESSAKTDPLVSEPKNRVNPFLP